MPPLRKGTNTIVSLCLLCLFAAGCRVPPDSDVKIAFEVEPHPPRVGRVTVTVRVTRLSTGKPISGLQVRLEGNMTHAGMAAEFAEAPEVERGVYRANLKFTMAGDWIILVHLTLWSGAKVDRQFEIKGVAPAE